MFLKKYVVVVWALFATLPLWGQSSNIPLSDIHYWYIDRADVLFDTDYITFSHTSFKPYNTFNSINFLYAHGVYSNKLSNIDSTNFLDLNKAYPEHAKYRVLSKKPILKHFYKYPGDFYRLDLDKASSIWFAINPVIYFMYMREKGQTESLFLNTRGLEIRGEIATRLGFYTRFTENQARFPSFINSDFVNGEYPSVPGVGYFRKFKTSTGVDYFTATGYVSFKALREIEMQFGHGQHFIGNGLRSLILSNETANALYFKIQTNVWKFQYTNLFQQLTRRFDNLGDGLREPKYMALHHLSYNITQNLNFGIFESVIFDRDDGFELQYLNPLIFYRAIERDLGSPDNVIVGIDAKWNIWKHLSLYSQFVLDEFHFEGLKNMDGDWRNKFGLQFGAKYYDTLFKMPFGVQIEYNAVRPYLYSHNSEAGAYVHYNRPLAHPLGANFHEIIGKLQLQPHKDILLHVDAMYAIKGLDTVVNDSTVTNYGGNIFNNYTTRVSEKGNSIAQGNRQTILNAEIGATYLFKTNLQLDLNVQLRSEQLADLASRNTWFLSIATRWNIARRQFLY